jgi:hypothetical protein
MQPLTCFNSQPDTSSQSGECWDIAKNPSGTISFARCQHNHQHQKGQDKAKSQDICTNKP